MLLKGGVARLAAGVSSSAPQNPAAARNVTNGGLGLQSDGDWDGRGVR
jgi:hypothetical protein